MGDLKGHKVAKLIPSCSCIKCFSHIPKKIEIFFKDFLIYADKNLWEKYKKAGHAQLTKSLSAKRNHNHMTIFETTIYEIQHSEVNIMRILFAFLLFSVLAAPVWAAEPMSTAPSVNPTPEEFGAGQPLRGAAPPQFPAYLPNGAINLDEVWIQDGGARLYWNYVIVPRQVKMGGAYWVDPALVPQLLLTQPARKTSRRVVRTVKPKTTSPAPVDASSRALRSPAIPLPVEPVPGKTSIVPPPFSPSQTRKPATSTSRNIPSQAEPGLDTNIPIPPPRLQ